MCQVCMSDMCQDICQGSDMYQICVRGVSGASLGIFFFHFEKPNPMKIDHIVCFKKSNLFFIIGKTRLHPQDTPKGYIFRGKQALYPVDNDSPRDMEPTEYTNEWCTPHHTTYRYTHSISVVFTGYKYKFLSTSYIR